MSAVNPKTNVDKIIEQAVEFAASKFPGADPRSMARHAVGYALELPVADEVAAPLAGFKVATWRKNRSLGRTPKHWKYGSTRSAMVRYRVADVLAWRDAHLRESDAE